ncbi:MAG: DUF4358 domain-containing protein [Lachnospiraceae bacterium]|nr:DUF4358 domain-containing protein [Lachnospiraceae bacterium]
MKRLVFLISVFFLLALAACGKKTGNDQKAATPTPTLSPDNGNSENKGNGNNSGKLPDGITPQSVEAAIAKALGNGYVADIEVPEEELYLCPLGDIDMEKIDAYVAKQNAVPSVHQDSVIVVKCKDASYADSVVQGFNVFYARSRKYAAIYPMEPFKVMGCRIFKAGDIVMYIVAGAPLPEDVRDDAGQLAFATAEYAKIDTAVKELLGFLPENLLDEDTEIPGDDPDNGSGESFEGVGFSDTYIPGE